MVGDWASGAFEEEKYNDGEQRYETEGEDEPQDSNLTERYVVKREDTRTPPIITTPLPRQRDLIMSDFDVVSNEHDDVDV